MVKPIQLLSRMTREDVGIVVVRKVVEEPTKEGGSLQYCMIGIGEIVTPA